jgi:hypothetical protein
MVADEVWLTNVIQGINAVVSFREKTYQNVNAETMINLINRDTASNS